MADPVEDQGQDPNPAEEGGASDAVEEESAAAPKRTRRRVRHNMQAGLMLSRTFSVWGRNVGPFSLLALVISVPAMIWNRFVASDPEAGVLVATVSGVLEWIVPMLVTAVICHSVFQQLADRPGGIGASIQKLLSRLPNVLGTSILAALMIAVGYVALIIPGIIIGLMLFVAIPVAVVEKPGVVAALKRSAALTEGNRLSLFALTVLVGVLVMIPAIALGLVFDTTTFLFTALTAVFGALVASFHAVLQAVVYHDLRAGSEGLDVQELADVFA